MKNYTSHDYSIYDCTLGALLNQSESYNKLEKLPKYIKEFSFLLGSSCEDLIETYSSSDYPEDTEYLAIGDSSDGLQNNGLEYSKLIKHLSTINFPKLKHLELGVWNLYCNSHCMFGSLGNITTLLNKTPNLEKLQLYGSFELNKPIELINLSHLYICLDDEVTGVNGGNLTNKTLYYLLTSYLPNIKKLNLFLECDDDINTHEYRLPNEFVSGLTFPNLRELEISGRFVNGQKEELLYSFSKNKPNVKLFTQYMVDT